MEPLPDTLDGDQAVYLGRRLIGTIRCTKPHEYVAFDAEGLPLGTHRFRSVAARQLFDNSMTFEKIPDARGAKAVVVTPKKPGDDV